MCGGAQDLVGSKNAWGASWGSVTLSTIVALAEELCSRWKRLWLARVPPAVESRDALSASHERVLACVNILENLLGDSRGDLERYVNLMIMRVRPTSGDSR